MRKTHIQEKLETLTNTGFVVVMGEITTKANVDITQIVRDTICEIGWR